MTLKVIGTKNAALINQSQTWTAPQTLTDTAIAQVPLTINGMVGQTGNLQTWQVNGTAVAAIAASGTSSFPSMSVANTSAFGRSVALFSVLGTSLGTHLVSTQTTLPTIALSSGATAATMGTGSTDIKGTINITSVGTTGLVMCTVTFLEAYASTPTVVLSGTALVLNGTTTTTGFAVVARDSTVSVLVNYIVIQ
jgi:hypothetical protein